MENKSIMDHNWEFILTMFPQNWEKLAKETKAVQHFKGDIKTLPDLMKVFFLHIANGYSLQETVARAKLSGLGNISNVTLMNRLKNSDEWFRQMGLGLISENGVQPPDLLGIKFKLFDATNIKEPGKTGSHWRLHYALTLPDLQCEHFELTEAKGQNTGESFRKFPVLPNDCFIGDRGYSRARDVEYVHRQQGYVLLRHNMRTFPLYCEGKRFNLVRKLKFLKNPGQTKEWNLDVKGEDGLIPGRLCVIRKDKDATLKAIKVLKRRASKNQTKLQPETIEYAKYIMVFTTLPKDRWSLSKILEIYRFRWQIELGFKRFKSLAQLGHLPKYDDKSSRAWLYAKLFVCLLTEKLVSKADSFSPWGPVVQSMEQMEESLA
jgi:hypothetical protein